MVIVVDVGVHFVKGMHNLEGDGPLAFTRTLLLNLLQ